MKRLLIVSTLLFMSFITFSTEKETNKSTNFDFALRIRHFNTDTSKEISSNTATDKVFKTLKILDITHMVLGGISYIGFVVDDGIGFSLFYNAYTNPNYYTDPLKLALQTAHKGVMVGAYLSYGVNAILGFVTLGMRVYYGLPINTFHTIMGFITTALYIFEIVSMSLTKYFYDINSPYKKEISLAHGMLSGTMTLAMTLAIIAVPVGYKHKKVWKVKIKG